MVKLLLKHKKGSKIRLNIVVLHFSDSQEKRSKKIPIPLRKNLFKISSHESGKPSVMQQINVSHSRHPISTNKNKHNTN